MARTYFGIPATSASSERFFSQGALIISKLRNRLSKETFEMLICLKSWGIFEDEEEVQLREDLKESLKNPEENQFFVSLKE
jgi:hypothetical protein